MMTGRRRPRQRLYVAGPWHASAIYDVQRVKEAEDPSHRHRETRRAGMGNWRRQSGSISSRLGFCPTYGATACDL